MKLLYSTLILASALLAPAGEVWAQARKGPIPRPEQVKPKRKSQAQKKEQRAQEIDRFQKMTPAERRQALDKLPPERRARIEQRLERTEMRLQRMKPAERQNLRRRYESFQALPADRKQAVRQEIRQLRALSPEERKKRLQSPETKKRFNEDERRLLEEVSDPGISPPAF